MKYILNQLPVKTTNNFHINNVQVDLDIPKFKMNGRFQINGDVSLLKIDKKIENKKINSRIGFIIDTYYSVSIIVPKNVVVDNTIIIEYCFENDDCLFDQINIIYEENSHCDFVLKYYSKDQNSHFHHLIENVKSDKTSCGNITFINMLNSNSKSFYSLENILDDNSSIIHTIIDIGASIKINNVYSDLVGYNSKNQLNAIYIGKDNDLLDFQYYLKNSRKNTQNIMMVEGVLNDSSHKNFRGTIDFLKGCSHSIGDEYENCVLLSDDCISRSLPQMLCGEEDVIGNHSVSSGKISEEKLFYLMSRGYSKKDALKMLLLANFQSVIHSIPLSLQTNILNSIDDILS